MIGTPFALFTVRLHIFSENIAAGIAVGPDEDEVYFGVTFQCF